MRTIYPLRTMQRNPLSTGARKLAIGFQRDLPCVKSGIALVAFAGLLFSGCGGSGGGGASSGGSGSPTVQPVVPITSGGAVSTAPGIVTSPSSPTTPPPTPTPPVDPGLTTPVKGSG
jgi:hypothetical protein